MGKAFTEISKGLDDAISHAKGKKNSAKKHRIEPIDVQSIREKTGMSQQRFCATFGTPQYHQPKRIVPPVVLPHIDLV